MALQDLTPQLRTRLRRVERAVGLFVGLAVILMIAGFCYYLYHTAQAKGWFLTKVPYFTLVKSAKGLKVGDPVEMMGFDVGQITRIEPQPPEDFLYNVYVQFQIRAPYYGYLWSQGSVAKIASADFLGKRVIEVTKGTNGVPTYLFWELESTTVSAALAKGDAITNDIFAADVLNPQTAALLAPAMRPVSPNLLQQLQQAGVSSLLLADTAVKKKSPTAIWNYSLSTYQPYKKGSKGYWLADVEPPALTERMESLIVNVDKALPGVFALTNSLAATLSNATRLTADADRLVAQAAPAVSNVQVITANLRKPKGSLGEWLLPTNLHHSLDKTLYAAHETLTNTTIQLRTVAMHLDESLVHLADMTSNLNAQVQVNTNILSQISALIVNADQFIQGLKHHWLFRSAFRKKKMETPSKTPLPVPGSRQGKARP